MGARFACGCGREGWVRTLLTAAGVGLGVVVLLVAASVPHMIGAREARSDARENYGVVDQPAPSDRTALYVSQNTQYRDENVRGRLLEPDGTDPPVPPGLQKLPGPGEMAVSPALRELLRSPEGELLRERLPYRITGTIGDQGLVGPQELAYYAGAEGLDPDAGAYRIDTFDRVPEGEPLHPVLLLLLVVICVVLLLPVGAFVAAAVRFGGERRDRRLAALRLVGADSRMTRRVAAGEAAAGALLGLVLGAALFLPLRQLAGSVRVLGFSAFPADVTPQPLLTVLIAVAVPACAVTVTLLALRGVAIEPLGVVRRSVPRRRRVWWRLLPAAAGLTLLLAHLDDLDTLHSRADTYPIAGGIVLVLIGVTALLPWLVESTVRRMRARTLPLQLAVRRLQLDSGTAARTVSGVTVAVAGAIALQMLFGAVAEQETRDTGHDTDRAQMLVQGSTGGGEALDGLTRRLAETRGVRGALGRTTGYAFPAGKDPEEVAYTAITVADCATLRELARIGSCRDGDAFLVPSRDHGATRPEARPVPEVRPGTRLDLALPDHLRSQGGAEREPELWRVPRDARTVPDRTDPTGGVTEGVLVTPEALDVSRMTSAHDVVYVRLDPGTEDAAEYVRNTVAAMGPAVSTLTLQDEEQSRAFAAIERGLQLGAVLVLLLIGASMIVSTLEQLRERKRLLSMLVAFGTRRSTLGWSVLWQTALPVLLGLLLAAVTGVGLGALLLRMAELPFGVSWTALGTMTGLGGALILLVTLVSLPALWRLMRPDGLRTE
ncbi:ABC transporter permease [Streptomyces sp. JJ36]|nr:ABC transporter permease [Streptomyces sp. JJ36]